MHLVPVAEKEDKAMTFEPTKNSQPHYHISCNATSVKKLNNAVVSHLIEEGINAVGISPCINIPGLMAHGGNETGGVTTLARSINECLAVGLVPVIHGDAGLYGYFDEASLRHISTGILGGDTLVEIIATHEALKERIVKTVFLTDVEGVYTKDPKSNEDAILIRNIDIDSNSGEIMVDISASGSSHEHDVTGGLETKLGAAANVAKSGIEVIIAKCCSASGEQAIKGQSMEGGTIIKSV
jgi:isopentenyl phosphate kinase